MPTMNQRLEAIEQRRRDTEHAAMISAGIHTDPAEAARIYGDFIREARVPTAEEAQRRHLWARLTPEQAKNLYLAVVSNPRFDADKAVAQILEGRP